MKNKFLNKKIAIIAGVALFGIFLIGVNGASANLIGDAARDILVGIFSVLLFLAQAFTGFVGSIFTGILNFGFQDLGEIQKAWEVVRDIVNMFFILGLVIIAFATILRIQQYGVKQLLPKIIIIALLINFSYILPAIIVDFSQIITNYFLNQIIKTVEVISGDETKIKEIGGAIVSSLNVNDALTTQVQTVPITTQNPDIAMILTMAFSTAVVFVTGFVMLIGSILLIIRIGAIWALLILAPIAWFFSIFPKLKPHTDKWWSEFFKWTFFAPIYVFFIYLVLKIAKEWTDTAIVSLGSSPTALSSIVITPMFQDISLLFRFVFLTILLFGAPVIAMSMGIKSAQGITSTAKGVLKGAGGLAWRKSTRYPGELATRGAGSALKGIGRAFQTIPGLKKFGGRIEARGNIVRQIPLSTKEANNLKKLYETLPDKALARAIKQGGALGLIATQVAIENKMLQRTEDRDAVRKSVTNLRAFNFLKEMGDLEELRFSMHKNDADQEKYYKKAKAKGKIPEFRAPTFKDEEDKKGNAIGDSGTRAVKTFIKSELTVTDVLETLKKMRTDAQEQIAKTLKPLIEGSDDFSLEAVKQRSAYAAIEGDIEFAFRDKNSKINDKELGVFVKRMKPVDWAKLKAGVSVEHAAKHINAGAARSMTRHISDELRQALAENFTTSVREELAGDRDWGSYIKTGGNVVDLKPKQDKETRKARENIENM